MGTIYQTSRDHLAHQARDKPPQKLAIKQIHTAAIAKASKAMVALTRRAVHKQASILSRERLAAAARYELKAIKCPVKLYIFAYGALRENSST